MVLFESMNKRNIGCFLLLFDAMIWGFGISFQSILGNSLGAYTVVFFKGIAGILLIPIVFLLKGEYTKDSFIGGLICGFIMLFANVFQQKGIETASSGKASFITGMYMVFVPILGSLLFKEKTKPHVWFGVLLALLGSYFLCVKEEFILKAEDIYLFIGTICFGLQILFADKYVKKANPISICSIQLISMGIMSSILMFIYDKPTVSQILDSKWVLMYVSLLGSVAALAIQFIFQKHVEPTLASLLMSLESVFGVIGGFLILNQVLSLKEIFGCVLIFIAVLIAQKE